MEATKCLQDIKTEGLRGIRTMLRAVLIYGPKFWVIENVFRSAPWITDILQISHQICNDGTLKPYITKSVPPDCLDKSPASYEKTKLLAKMCFKRYGRPILLHVGSGSGGRYFFGHFPSFPVRNSWVKKKTVNSVRTKEKKRKIIALGNPATRSLIDKKVSKAFADAFLKCLRPKNDSIERYLRRLKRQKRRLGIDSLIKN